MADSKSNSANSENDERPRGLLAPVDRAYLRGNKKYSHRQTAYDREAKIRERLREGVFDLQLVASEMDDEELEKALGDYPDNSELWGALTDVVAFIFRVTALKGLNENLLGEKQNYHFEEAVEQGMHNGYLMDDCILDEYEMTHRTTHIPELLDQIKAGEDADLSAEFIRRAIQDEAIDSEPIQQEIRRQLSDIAEGTESEGPSGPSTESEEDAKHRN
jgi:hypothetical protein